MNQEEARQMAVRAAVAEEVRAVMGRRNVNGTELARRTGWSQSKVSRLLHCEVPFDIDELDAVARALGTPLSELLSMIEAKRLLLDSAIAA